jgi:asparagine synthase (glutamine-hydrolysing)
MCGIAGIVGRISAGNRTALKRMNDAMQHRGPDAAGLWESSQDDSGWGAMLAHRRLSILDLSPAGAQPMLDPASGNVVVLNGEIYNFVELRQLMVAAGEQFQSSGDTAVMLRAMSIYGRAGVRRLRGMFAFAFWDQSARTLLLARDPLGIKPLYLTRNPDSRGDWSLAFASEVRALLASGLLVSPKLNPSATAAVVWNGFMVSPETAVRGIESIWPGQLRIFGGTGDELHAEQFWSVPRGRGDASEADVASALQESVRLHLASDVPLGVFLSGGVDSASVANLATRVASEQVHTFTLAFEEDEFNEGNCARRIADAIGTHHREIILTESDFIDQLEPALDSLDQPTFDGLNSFYMSHAVRQAGFKVALAGTGGDEMFGGYTSFRDLPQIHSWGRRMNWLPPKVSRGAARIVAELLQPSKHGIAQQTRWAKLPAMVDRSHDLIALYQQAYALFLPEFHAQMLSEATAGKLTDGLPSAMYSRLHEESRDRSPLAALSVMEQRMFLGERLLRDTDAASMSASIEIRLPLVDSLLLEVVNGLPDKVRFEPLGKKSLLRRIGLVDLDPGLFSRPKTGFVLPYDRWLRLGVGRIMDEVMRDPLAIAPTGLNPMVVERLWQAFLKGHPGIYWSRVWAIFVLIRWCDRHKVHV